MDKKNLVGQIHNSMYQQVKKQGYATTVGVLMDIGILSKVDYERWRNGHVDYLERVCKVNLHKLSEIAKIIRQYADKKNLKQSWAFYRQWKCSEKRKLRFSKSGGDSIEKSYATHYVAAKAR